MRGPNREGNLQANWPRVEYTRFRGVPASLAWLTIGWGLTVSAGGCMTQHPILRPAETRRGVAAGEKDPEATIATSPISLPEVAVPADLVRTVGYQQTQADAERIGGDPELSLSAAGDTPQSIPQATPAQPIDLPTALRLADRQNPTIGSARITILAALAGRQAAYSLLLPTLNAGTNYHDHVGVLQRGNGAILPVTEQALYVGAGARTVAAQTVAIPGINIFSPLADAIFEPLVAQQRVRAARTNAAASANTVLLDVARLYLRLLGAQAAYEARKGIGKQADQIAAAVLSYATTGQGRRSDAERADAYRRLFQTQILRAEEMMAVTSALLAEQLNLDPSARLQPMNGSLEPIELIDPATPVESLIVSALTRRPDLETVRAAVAEANYQIRREKARPFLPTVYVGFSGGAFGGGSNLVPPTFKTLGSRTDFDAQAYWTLLNSGAGNLALVKQRQAQARQVQAGQARLINTIRLEVTATRARSLALKSQLTLAQNRLRSADDGFAQDQTRLRETLAKPIEALDSLNLQSEARIALVEAITDYNQAQFALFVALGSPPPL